MAKKNQKSLIRLYREAIGLSQADLCRLTGFSAARLSNYEVGSRVPDINAARAILRALRASGSDIQSVDELYP